LILRKKKKQEAYAPVFSNYFNDLKS